jgi:hypothetical protein
MSRKSYPASYKVLESLIVKLSEFVRFNQGCYSEDGEFWPDSFYPNWDDEDREALLTSEESITFRRIIDMEKPVSRHWLYSNAYNSKEDN